MSIIGTQIRDLKILSAIGEGGMGIVYLAEHVRLGKKFAVKCLNPEMASSSALQERFRKEAMAQARLLHPNIVQVTDFFEEHGHFYLLMEYVAGSSLDEIIESDGMLPEKICVPYLKDILNGLNFAHSQGVIHRDIKPSNIIIDPLDRARIMDFGIAIQAGEKRLTKTGTDVGTAWYMSPEQVLRPKEIDHRSDVYSVGVVLYEMLTGQVPFDGETDYAVKDKHVRETPTPVDSINTDIPPELAGIVMKALEKDPDDRFNGCGEFLEYIEAYEREKPSESSSGHVLFQRKSAMEELQKDSGGQDEEQTIAPNLPEASEPAIQPDGYVDSPAPEPTFTDPVTGMEFLHVPGGRFLMGDIFGAGNSDEQPVREMEVAAFYMGKTPVTQGQWESVMGNNPSRFNKGESYPVEMVSWEDAQEFIRKLTSMNDRKHLFRLPTDAEWEFAARSGGKDEKYAGGNTIEPVAWYNENSVNSTHPVGEKESNGLGLLDMSGNIYEWCEDWLTQYQVEGFHYDAATPTATERVLRGGSWDSHAAKCRSSARYGNWPKYRDNNWGCRLVMDMAPPEPLEGNLRIVTIPKGASIWMDGIDTGQQTDAIMNLPAGNYQVALKLDGCEDAEQEVAVTQYDISEMEFRFEKKPAKGKNANIEKASGHTSAPKKGVKKIWITAIALVCAAVFYLGFAMFFQDANRKIQPVTLDKKEDGYERHMENENQAQQQAQADAVREKTSVEPSTSISPPLNRETTQGCIWGNCNDGYGTYVFSEGSKYTGAFKGNNPHGEGTYTTADGKRYTGQFHNGRKEGGGTLIFPDGSEYIGSFKEDKPHGKGIFTSRDGSKYEGEWSDGRPHGKGTFVHSDGGKYVGEYKNGRREGKGTLTYSDGSEYAGAFKEDNPYGKGTFASPDGSKYEGEWKDGKRDGKGTFVYSDGGKYTGMFKDDLPHGNGTFVSAGGEKYVGEYRNGKREGKGTLTYPDGSEYAGDFRNGDSHGQGTLTIPKVGKYKGEWENGRPYGKGILFSSDGRKFMGEYKDVIAQQKAPQKNLPAEETTLPETDQRKKELNNPNKTAYTPDYIFYDNGIVKDTKTDLEWKVGPNKSTTWDEARSWVQSLNLDGGGWRMPTMDELAGLYKKHLGYRNLTPLLKTTGWWGWSGEIQYSSTAWAFNFSKGNGVPVDRSYSSYWRAFAVRRSRSDG